MISRDKSKSEVESPRLLKDRLSSVTGEGKVLFLVLGDLRYGVVVLEVSLARLKSLCCLRVFGFRRLNFGVSVDPIVFSGVNPPLFWYQ